MVEVVTRKYLNSAKIVELNSSPITPITRKLTVKRRRLWNSPIVSRNNTLNFVKTFDDFDISPLSKSEIPKNLSLFNNDIIENDGIIATKNLSPIESKEDAEITFSLVEV